MIFNHFITTKWKPAFLLINLGVANTLFSYDRNPDEEKQSNDISQLSDL